MQLTVDIQHTMEILLLLGFTCGFLCGYLFSEHRQVNRINRENKKALEKDNIL